MKQSSEGFVKMQTVVAHQVSDSVGHGQNTKTYISAKFPGNAEPSWVHGGGGVNGWTGARYILRTTG